jgi:hypothetical protein
VEEKNEGKVILGKIIADSPPQVAIRHSEAAF